MRLQNEIDRLLNEYPPDQVMKAVINHYSGMPFMATGIEDTIDEIDYLGPEKGCLIGYGTKYEVTVYNYID